MRTKVTYLPGRVGKLRHVLTALALAAGLGGLTAVSLVMSVPAVAGAARVPPGSCGQVLLAGSAWLSGRGVAVKSNGADEGLSTDCSSTISKVNGITAGEEWQCVEMINRLYLTKHWISTTWKGNAGSQFYDDAPAKLSKQANGSVSYLGPGDVVIINVFYQGTPEGGMPWS